MIYKINFQKIIEVFNSLKKYSLKEERTETYIDLFLLFSSFLIFLFLNLNTDFENKDIFIRILFYVFIFSFIDFVITFLRNIILLEYRRRNKINIDDDSSDNLIIAVYRVHKIIQILAFIILLFTFFKIDLTNFLTFFGVFFFGIIFLFKDFLLNFFYGLFLAFTNKIRVKDDIIFEDEYGAKNYRGTIKNIYFSMTELVLEDGSLFYISNSRFMNGRIINLTTAKKRKIEIFLDVKNEIIQNFEKHTEKLNKLFEKKEIVIKEINFEILSKQKNLVNLRVDIFTSKDSFNENKNKIKFLVLDYFK